MGTHDVLSDPNRLRFDGSRTHGHVESYFLKLNDPTGRRALWLKATILARLGAQPVAEAWAIAFDRDGTHVAAKEVVPWRSRCFAETGLGVAVARLVFESGRAHGEVTSGGQSIAFDLSFTTDGAALFPLPPATYRLPFPRAKAVTPFPDARFTGWYSIDGERIEVASWHGMQGHNWGRAHTELYAWGHCNQWDDGEDLVLEGATARVRVGPLLTPPTTVLCVVHRGVRHLFRGARELVTSRGSIEPTHWTFRARHRGARVEGEFWADTRDFAALLYENPSGPPTYCLNTKLAHGRLRLEVGDRPPLVATTRAAALEVGTKTGRHGVRMVA